jgi:hypothetical protein
MIDETARLSNARRGGTNLKTGIDRINKIYRIDRKRLGQE